MWTIFNKTNAVEGMALTIRFAEAINSKVGKRISEELERVARLEGFIDKQPLQQFQIDVSTQAVRPTLTNGVALQHMSVMRNQVGFVEPTLVRQLVVQPEQFILQIHHYRSWEKEWESAIKMLDPALRLAAPVAQVASLRLEYMNRFIFDGNDEDAVGAGLLNSSQWLAGLSLTSTDFWHSHSGRFDDHVETTRRLTQVNADMQTLTLVHPMQGRRSLSLMLAVERQFSGAGMEAEDTDITSKLDKTFCALHDDIHHLFKEIIDSKFASDNGLPA